MYASFRKIFFPTEDELKKQQEFIENIQNEDKTYWLSKGLTEQVYADIKKYIKGGNNMIKNIRPLTISQLKKKDKKPVYIICNEFPQLDGWYIVHFDKQTQRIECWGYDSNKFDSINYGTWLAYLNEL